MSTEKCIKAGGTRVHEKHDSWWAHDVQGIPLRRVCDDCEHLLEKEYAPEVLGISGRYEDVVEEQIDAD